MPTKRNKAGNQQPYVPQGNGDASGEYADNQSGSNKHFTNFSKPEENGKTILNGGTTEKAPSEPVKKGLKERLQFGDTIEENLKRDYKRYLNYGLSKDNIKERLTEHLINGDYGSFIRPRSEWQSKFEDYYDSMSEWMEENKPQKYYYKRGNKWVGTYDKWDFSSRKYYTESEYQEKLAKEQVKNLKQSKYDVEINKIFGENCAVAFGKGYSDEYMAQVVSASKQVANDFPNMNGFIKALGDRNSLEKLTQARAREGLTPENIDKVANEIIKKQKEIFNRDVSLEDAREKAKQQIVNGGLSLSRSGARTLAYWSPSQKALVMLPKTAKDNADANQVSYYQQNWHSSDKPMATYFHEFGHAIDSMVADLYDSKYKALRNNLMNSDNYNKSLELNKLKHDFNEDIYQLQSQNINSQYNDEYVKRYNELAGTNYQNKRDIEKDLARTFNYEKHKISSNVVKSLKEDGIRKFRISEYGASNSQEFCAECFSAYYTGMNNELANQFVERVKKFYNDLRGFEV